MARILVIDDDAFSRLLLRRILQDNGHEVIVTSGGVEGILQAKRTKPALIISDWIMPKIDGLEVCRQIKADPELANTFFILNTARRSLDDHTTGVNQGADAYLFKPINRQELESQVQAGLRLYNSAQALKDLTDALISQQQRLEAQFNEVAGYVRSQLPLPTTEPLTINYQFEPSTQVGGDFFDYAWLDVDHLMIYLLDVTGHGLGAALLSQAIQALIKTRSLPPTTLEDPAALLRSLNQHFPMQNHCGRSFTMWYGVYQPSTRQLTYASAGHPPALLLSPQAITQLKTPGRPVGMFPDSHYSNQSCPVTSGSSLYLFSDGLYEELDQSGGDRSLATFTQILLNFHNAAQSDPQRHPIDQLVRQVKAEIQRNHFEDDCSLIQVQW